MSERAPWQLWIVAVGITATTEVAAAPVDRLELIGARRTRESTFESLLPRPLPTDLSPAEVEEFTRRVHNLEVFDDVVVELRARRLEVTVREKWTLIPFATFSTGATAADFFIAAGVTEHNFLGTGAKLGVAASWEQRGPNASLWWWQHEYAAQRGAYWGEIEYASASYRFDDGSAWFADTAGAGFGWVLPFWYGSPLRWDLAATASHERMRQIEGAGAPPDGVAFGTALGVVLDRYTWADLAPHGYRIGINGGTGAFVPATEPRHQANAEALFAIAPTKTTVLIGRATWGIVTSGNANHSLLLGSLGGVRGLDDAFYRNRSQLVGNVELRQAWRFAKRWALQGALFGDAASFEPFDARGRTTERLEALAVGGGVRLVPTFLATVVLRVDQARLVAPEGRWFTQVAVSQYF